MGPLSGERVAVLLWNRRHKRDVIKVDWKVLQLDNNRKYKVRDLWEVS